MADFVLYNNPALEGHLQGIIGLNQRGQDLAQSIMQRYNTLDGAASGQATNAGMEFARYGNQIRGQAADITTEVHAAGVASQTGMNEMDAGFTGLMGV